MNENGTTEKILIDFSDNRSVKEAMKMYDGTLFMLSAVNSEGENQIITIFPDSVEVTTFQHNRWIRINYYDSEGYPEGETFDGKW